jgi:uroporphyrinogen-III decarboxylase
MNPKDYTLRNHIPIAGAGNREPCTGNESSFRVALGFTPKWYKDRLGINFSEKWHEDPLYRYETLVLMKKYLSPLFPSIENFRPRYEGDVDYDCATLNGVYGSLVMSGVYGQKIHFFEDNWPSVDTSKPFTKEELSNMPPFDPETNPFFRKLSDQMDRIEKTWGKVSGYLAYYQGVLNNAMRLRGQDIFMDMAEDPDFVKWLLNHIFETTLAVTKLIQQRQRDSGFFIDQFSCSNCVVNMISPDMYEEFVLPFDMKFAAEFKRFGIHTCNWNATPYLESMRKIDKMGYLDMGMDSDMRKARSLFPDARRGVLYSPVKIGNLPLDEIRRDFEKIHEELGPCDIILADIESTVANEKVQAVVDMADAIAESAVCEAGVAFLRNA